MELFLCEIQRSIEALFINALGLDLIILVKIFFKIPGNTFGDLVVVYFVGDFETLRGSDLFLAFGVDCGQVFSDAD